MYIHEHVCADDNNICVYMHMFFHMYQKARQKKQYWLQNLADPGARLLVMEMFHLSFATFFGDNPVAYKSENTQSGPTGPPLVPRVPFEGNKSELVSRHSNEMSKLINVLFDE